MFTWLVFFLACLVQVKRNVEFAHQISGSNQYTGIITYILWSTGIIICAYIFEMLIWGILYENFVTVIPRYVEVSNYVPKT